jgi:hypothetical protein
MLLEILLYIFWTHFASCIELVHHLLNCLIKFLHTMTRLWAGWLRNHSIPSRVKIFPSSPKWIDWLSDLNPPNQWVPRAPSLGLKWVVHEAEQPPPSSFQVKNERRYTSTVPYAFMPQVHYKELDTECVISQLIKNRWKTQIMCI